MNTILLAWILFAVFGAIYVYLIWLGRKVNSLKFDISLLETQQGVIRGRIDALDGQSEGENHGN